MTTSRHLTEAERHGAADGSLADEPLRHALAHLAECDDCARDVDRLKTLMTQLRDLPATGDVDDLWPDVRSRIEQSKVVPLAAVAPAAWPRPRYQRPLVLSAAVIAAAVLIITVTRGLPARHAVGATDDSGASLINVADSTQQYESEANTLLDELEMQRAMLPPGAGAAIDRDLQTIDRSIAEINAALQRDPNSPELRRLLASSYRQKVDLLKRAHNAG